MLYCRRIRVCLLLNALPLASVYNLLLVYMCIIYHWPTYVWFTTGVYVYIYYYMLYYWPGADGGARAKGGGLPGTTFKGLDTGVRLRVPKPQDGVYACVCVCMSICMCIHTHTHTHTYTHIHTHTHTHTHTCGHLADS